MFPFSSKVNEVNEWKNKFQSESGSLKEEIKKNQGDVLSKEKQIQQLVENCKNLEKQVAEYSKARNDVEEKSANSLEEIKVELFNLFFLLDLPFLFQFLQSYSCFFVSNLKSEVRMQSSGQMSVDTVD